MKLKAYDRYSYYPTTRPRAQNGITSHISAHISAQPFEDHKAKVPIWGGTCSHQGRAFGRTVRHAVISRRQAVSELWSFRVIFFFLKSLGSLPANKKLSQRHLPLQEAGRSLLTLAGSSSDAVEMAANFTRSFTTLCCLALWGFTCTCDGKSGKSFVFLVLQVLWAWLFLCLLPFNCSWNSTCLKDLLSL